MGDGGRRAAVRVGVRDLPTELRLRGRRRRAEAVHPRGAPVASDADRRPRQPAAPADLGRGRRALGVRRPTLHVPTGLMRMQATVLERLPNPPVTRDQLTMLEAGDNVVANDEAVETFKLPLVPLDDQLRRAA